MDEMEFALDTAADAVKAGNWRRVEQLTTLVRVTFAQLVDDVIRPALRKIAEEN